MEQAFLDFATKMYEYTGEHKAVQKIQVSEKAWIRILSTLHDRADMIVDKREIVTVRIGDVEIVRGS